jgi:hypothetical protein
LVSGAFFSSLALPKITVNPSAEAGPTLEHMPGADQSAISCFKSQMSISQQEKMAEMKDTLFG